MTGPAALAYRRAGFLRYAAIQYVALTACAMAAYAGGTWFDPWTDRYELTGNFLSDLGMTHAFSGRTNYVSSALFVVAMASIGAALVAFGWTWRGFAFQLGRARLAGHASLVFATASGLAFIGIGLAPLDVVLTLHNNLVVAAFSLLLGYVASVTILMWRNEVSRARIAVNLCYLALVLGYVAMVLFGPRLGGTEHGHRIQVIAQKTIAYGSMVHVVYLTTTTRRALTS